jgi:glycine cleavage system aminomethyltransferase T
VSKDGEPAGTLTSPCRSPTLEQVIGLAVLRDAVHEQA